MEGQHIRKKGRAFHIRLSRRHSWTPALLLVLCSRAQRCCWHSTACLRALLCSSIHCFMERSGCDAERNCHSPERSPDHDVYCRHNIPFIPNLFSPDVLPHVPAHRPCPCLFCLCSNQLVETAFSLLHEAQVAGMRIGHSICESMIGEGVGGGGM